MRSLRHMWVSRARRGDDLFGAATETTARSTRVTRSRAGKRACIGGNNFFPHRPIPAAEPTIVGGDEQDKYSHAGQRQVGEESAHFPEARRTEPLLARAVRPEAGRADQRGAHALRRSREGRVPWYGVTRDLCQRSRSVGRSPLTERIFFISPVPRACCSPTWRNSNTREHYVSHKSLDATHRGQ